jgi:hypothetical protein
MRLVMLTETDVAWKDVVLPSEFELQRHVSNPAYCNDRYSACVEQNDNPNATLQRNLGTLQTTVYACS